MHCGSFIARTVSKIIRKTGNPPHRNGINRHHAAEKPQDVPPICIPGRHPLSLQASIGPLPAFPGKAETGIPPRSPALRRPNPKRPTFSRTLGRSLSTPSESGRRPDSNLFHPFFLSVTHRSRSRYGTNLIFMKQKAFAWGFIFFFVVTFIALWGDDGFSSIDIWGFVLVCIPCGFVGFLGGAIAMVMVKNKRKEDEE